MIKYQLTALALKAFSVTPQMRAMYRQLGNATGNRRNASIPDHYIDHGRWLLDRLPEGMEKALELGTGWLHFHGVVTALARGCEVDLYDVWDNRHTERFRAAFNNPEDLVRRLGRTDDPAASRAAKLAATGSLQEAYQALGLKYVLDPGGVLAPLEANHYDAVFSMDVLEHVFADHIEAAAAGMFRVLKPGGVALHQIGLDDHLWHYDRTVSAKQYLAYSDPQWALRFDNAVQYINRQPFSRFLSAFKAAGFEIEETSIDTCDISQLRVAARYRQLSLDDLQAVRGYVVCRKPALNA